MHTYKSIYGTIFNYNSDFSGNIEITCGLQKCSIPAVDMLDCVAEYIKTIRISEIESMSYKEVLK